MGVSYPGQGPLLLAGLGSRAALLAWGAWQDAHWAVKYTDIDYEVVTDAARAVLAGGSPYDRATFRYSPLLAWVALPNLLIHPAAAKTLFSAADLAVAWMMDWLLRSSEASARLRAVGLCLWLFSPLTAVISTRGSGEALVACMLLGMLCALRGRHIALAGLAFGLAVHWRIYPIIYALPLLRHLAMRRGSRLLSVEGVVLGTTAAASFLALGMLGHAIYGPSFLQETYLYHLGRVDPRHNFSSYFLPAYLGSEGAGLPIGWCFGLAQVSLVSVLGWRFASDLPYCMLLQTLAFVVFNKVSTAQYFVWYASLLPLVLPRLAASPNKRRLVQAAAMCIAAILHWLAWAYSLEFLGWSVFVPLWTAGIGVLGAKTWLLTELIRVPVQHSMETAEPSRKSKVS